MSASNFHHGGNFGVYVYADDKLVSAGYDDDLVDVEYDAPGYEHVGTYNLASEHDRAVYFAVLDRAGDPVAKFDHRHYDDAVVVHRRL